DFFSSPRLSPDGGSLTWLAWDHPNMPWNGTTLYIARLAADGTVGAPAIIAGGPAESIFQPEWFPDGTAIAVVSDRSGWWNLYRQDVAEGAVTAIAPMEAEFGQPQWVFGLSTYAFAGRNRLVATYSRAGLGQLAMIELTTGALRTLDLPFTEFGSLRARDDHVVFRAGAPTLPTCIVSLDLKAGGHRILKQSTDLPDPPALPMRPPPPRFDPVKSPTRGGEPSSPWSFPPPTAHYRAPPNDNPPPPVKSNGGPTPAASGAPALGTQSWTSR